MAIRAPLFPLPNVLLYPSAILPIHVFETRYVHLVEDLLARGEDRLVLGLLRDGWEDDYFGSPPVHPVAGLAQVLHFGEKLDGRYNILVQGIGRVQILRQTGRGVPYRLVEVEPLAEREPPPPQAEALRRALRDGLIDFADGSLMVQADAPLGYLADVLLVALPTPIEEKQELFAILDQRLRAEKVLQLLERAVRDRRSWSAAPMPIAAGWN